MLSVPLFTAEALLRNHEWSRETLLEAWMDNPVVCCEKCGVTPPSTLFSDKPQVQESLASPLPSPSHASVHSGDVECNICTTVFQAADEPVHMTCAHQFCRDCWEKYLTMKIQEGDAHHITCPAFNCPMLVPVEIIENIVSRDMALRYLQFDIKAFVDSNPDMKWCPYPGCGRAVKLPELSGLASSTPRTRNTLPSDTSRSVDCGAAHYFCWECQGEAHEPCSCENWVKWQQKIADIKPEKLSGTEEETEMAANCLWLVTNSKPCPNCKSPIQKNEGCNHMKCSKCKHDFCWVCLEQWKRHNSSTGGYFKCNRYEVVKKVEEQAQQVLTDAEERNARMQELNRFVHYYTRFKNHENSYKLEEPLLQTAKDKMMKLAEAVTDIATANAETQFVEDAVRQLLKARRVLKCSYIYGYYLDGPGYKKIVFEFMQTELEECTEILSQMVNRLYLRTPRARIIEQARNVQRRRLEFTGAIAKGLVPPETPPSMKKGKRRRKYSMETEDEDLRKAIMASIQEVDPGNPWIKDASGRHTNVMALLEWPMEDSDDSDSEVSVSALREYGKCHRIGCNRPKAVNPRTQQIHDYCSRRCKHHHEMLVMQDLEQQQEEIPEVILDEHMDLLRALEMSRLQFLRDKGLLHEPEDQGGERNDQQSQQQQQQQPQIQASGSRPRSNSSAGEVKKRSRGMTPLEELDFELQRVLELTSSIAQTSGGETAADMMDQSSRGIYLKRKFSQSRFEENASTIVTRVPNKSVEDLYQSDSCSKTKASPGQNEGSSLSGHLESSQGGEHPSTSSYYSPASASPEGACSMWSDDQRGKPAGGEGVSVEGGMFGLIKDLSVSNIHADESDKTSEFLAKDFQALFRMCKGSGDMNTSNEDPVGEKGSCSFQKVSPGYLHQSTFSFNPTLSLDTSAGSSSSTMSFLPPDQECDASTNAALLDPHLQNCASLYQDGSWGSKSFDGSSASSGGRYKPKSSNIKNKSNHDLDASLATAESGRLKQERKSGTLSAPVIGASLKKNPTRSSVPVLLSHKRRDGAGEVKEQHISLLEMAEHLLQMTAEMRSHMQLLHHDKDGASPSSSSADMSPESSPSCHPSGSMCLESDIPDQVHLHSSETGLVRGICDDIGLASEETEGPSAAPQGEGDNDDGIVEAAASASFAQLVMGDEEDSVQLNVVDSLDFNDDDDDGEGSHRASFFV
ncbi:uncharacterized protein LOC112563582 isoform X2 [Pomacea canaliculata]|nr:uncharacterized protein LOC112563582 isoform X2 [Pomacea canaliculata]